MRPIILRNATPNDLRFVRLFHDEQNQRDGTSYPLPQFFDKAGAPTDRVPVSLVGVPEGALEPVQAIWVERRAELMFAGCDPKATAFARRDIDGLIRVLAWLGYSGLHCDAPMAIADAISKPLDKAGFRRVNELASFYREVK